MARTQRIADTDILDAAVSLVSQYGPEELTFARLGQEVQLSPATLVQRFGAKQQLLARTAEHCLVDMTQAFDAARRTSDSPLQAIPEALSSLAASVSTVEAFVHGLSFLQMDLTDPKLHKLTLEGAELTRGSIRQLLDEAAAAGELGQCDTVNLADTIQTTYHGSLITWAIYQEGAIEDWVRKRIADVIEPYRKR